MEQRFYKITADYRPRSSHSPSYLVAADTAREARRWFSEHFTWLKIYTCEQTEDEGAAARALNIPHNPEIYIYDIHGFKGGDI